MKMRYVLASGSSAAREIDMNKMKSVICFLALGAISPHAWATPNNDDIKAMLSQAKSGDASAQTQLGILYAEGSGVTRDYKKARSWFEQAMGMVWRVIVKKRLPGLKKRQSMAISAPVIIWA